VSLQGFSSSAAIDAAGHMPHFVGCSGDDAANGGDTR
jgi:hypothetical protein